MTNECWWSIPPTFFPFSSVIPPGFTLLNITFSSLRPFAYNNSIPLLLNFQCSIDLPTAKRSPHRLPQSRHDAVGSLRRTPICLVSCLLCASSTSPSIILVPKCFLSNPSSVFIHSFSSFCPQQSPRLISLTFSSWRPAVFLSSYSRLISSYFV